MRTSITPMPKRSRSAALARVMSRMMLTRSSVTTSVTVCRPMTSRTSARTTRSICDSAWAMPVGKARRKWSGSAMRHTT